MERRTPLGIRPRTYVAGFSCRSKPNRRSFGALRPNINVVSGPRSAYLARTVKLPPSGCGGRSSINSYLNCYLTLCGYRQTKFLSASVKGRCCYRKGKPRINLSRTRLPLLLGFVFNVVFSKPFSNFPTAICCAKIKCPLAARRLVPASPAAKSFRDERGNARLSRTTVHLRFPLVLVTPSYPSLPAPRKRTLDTENCAPTIHIYTSVP